MFIQMNENKKNDLRKKTRLIQIGYILSFVLVESIHILLSIAMYTELKGQWTLKDLLRELPIFLVFWLVFGGFIHLIIHFTYRLKERRNVPVDTADDSLKKQKIPLLKKVVNSLFFWIIVSVVLAILLLEISFYDYGPEFNIVSRNVSSKELSKVSIEFDNRNYGCGYLPPSIESSYMLANKSSSIPDKANVSWVTEEDGKKYYQIVEVKKNIPEGFSDINIIFIFGDDNTVTVEFEQIKE